VRSEDNQPPRDYAQLEAAVQKAGIGVLHINGQAEFFSEPNFSRFLSRIRAQGIKVIVELHCIYSLNSGGHSLLVNADKVIVHSPENRIEAIACGAAPETVVVMPHGVTIREPQTSETKASLREKLGLPQNDTLIVSLGFIQPHKGLDSVMEAVSHLRKRSIPAHGVIVGQTRSDSPRGVDYLRKLKDYAATVGDGNHVTFVTSFVPDEQVQEYLAAADLVMLDYRSRYIESSGACSLAIGAGALVAASLAPAMLAFGDAVWHMTDGYKPAISAELLLTDETLQKELRKNAKAYADKHSWRAISVLLSQIYSSIGFSFMPRHLRGTDTKKESPVTTTYTPKKAVKPLRILMQNRTATFSARGGDTVVLEHLRDGLIARGCNVTIDTTGHADPGNYDLVHLFNFATPDVTRARAEAAVKAGVPFVVTTLYEEVPEFHNQSQAVATRLKEYVARRQDKEFWEKYKINLALVPRAARFDNDWVASHAAALFANGESEKKAIERDYPKAKTPTVIPLGHEVGALVGPEAFVKEYGVSDFVLCVGRFESRKNQLMLLKALENSELTVVFASGGFTYQPDYTEAIRSFKRKGRTIVLDRLSPEMLSSAYAACRVHVLASWFELPGLVSLEAAAHGKNVVATRTGTTADYLGPSAFYCLPWDEDSIEAAVSAAYYAPVKSGVGDIAGRFTWNVTIDQTLAAYESVLGLEGARSASFEASASTAAAMPVYDLSSDPTDLADSVERGELAATEGDFDTAISLLEKAEAIHPTSPRTLKALGAVYLAKSDVPKALGYFERAIKLAPNDVKVVTGRGMCDLLNGQYKTAMPYFEKAVVTDPTHLVSINQLLRCGFETGEMASSEIAITRYLAAKPGDVSMRFCLAGCLFKLGKQAQALAEVEKVIAAEPSNESAQQLKQLIQEALSQQTKLAQATTPATTAQPVVKTPSLGLGVGDSLNDSLAALSQKIAEWKVGASEAPTQAKVAEVVPTMSKEEVEHVTKRINPVPPMQSGSGVNQGNGYIDSKLSAVEDLRRDRKVEEARKVFESIRTAFGMTPQQEARVKCLEAEFLVVDGKLAEAERAYEAILEIDNANARALCGKGALAAESQRWGDAKQFFDRALAARPGYDVALAGLGLCEMIGQKHETAFDLFKKAAQANPENQRALLGVLQVGYPLKKYGEIEVLLARYLDIHPASTDMLYSFAGVLFAQGKMQQARMEIEKILLFEPANTKALELRQMIEKGSAQGVGASVPN
jgi:glycosyltransferase involved in cell wall biosynthesis/Tfp pilus assembly protein PilF